MALSLSLASHSIIKLTLCKQDTVRRLRSYSTKIRTFRNDKTSGPLQIRAVRENAISSTGEREIPVINGMDSLKLNGNGNGSIGSYLMGNDEGKGSENGVTNGSLVRYVNGDSVAAKVVGEGVSDSKMEAVAAEKAKEKKTVEDIGQEEAWFKLGGRDQLEVSVAPGGRWNRFKTYSTIQRTLEIWGFVLTFIFKAWLNNQKFVYKGGITEEKRRLKRVALAKWLKENILRLGPTFIKIGQQFSTRVDILAQEYVDQLSELQDQVPPFPSNTAVSIVEEELGAPLRDIFDRFDYEPIAAASLGQVHRARVKGQDVVVKVQRPGLKDLLDIDLKNLRVILLHI